MAKVQKPTHKPIEDYTLLQKQAAAEDLYMACKEAAVMLAEIAKAKGLSIKDSPGLRNILAAIAKADGKLQ